jgi:hypothetical protein
MCSQKSKIRGDESSRPAVHESSVDEARDRLAGLLADDALHDALNGLEPEEITGPGGLVSQLAGRVIETAGPHPEDGPDRARPGRGPHAARSSGQL